MNLRLLNAFVVLAEKQNYASAADALSISQPALTKQINLLESMLSVTLFARGRHGTCLTAGGKLLLPQAQKALRQTAVFLHHADQVARGREGVIAAGFGLSSFLFAPQCIAKFRSEYPGVAFTLEDLPSAKQYDMLQTGELQAGFVRTPAPAQLSYHTLFEDRLVLITPNKNDLSAAEWLKKLPLLRLYNERGRGLNAQTDRFLEENRLEVCATQQAEDIQTLVALVIAGIGVALLPQSVTHIAPPGLNILPLTGSATCWEVGIAWDPQTTDVIRDNFVKMVNACVAESE